MTIWYVCPSNQKKTKQTLQLPEVLQHNEWISTAGIIFQKLTDLKQLNSELACYGSNMDKQQCSENHRWLIKFQIFIHQHSLM